MSGHQSRPKRWEWACARIREGMEELQALQAEYGEWEVPENTENSPLAGKLQEMEDLDLTVLDEVLENAEGLDVPLGFGRD